jgi:DNA-binding transcriptional MerR regulator
VPRVARFTIDRIADLERQLRYAPRETRLREMKAAEALIGDIEPDRTYPEDFVVYRVTGYRREEDGEAPVHFAGAALIADLANLVQRLSAAIGLPPDHEGRQALSIDEVARRLRVSVKTVQRLRRSGLVCHYVRNAGRSRLVCFDDALERYVDRHAARLGRAASFTRMSREHRQAIVEEARRLRERDGLSLNAAAARLAAAHGRAHETMRGLLLRHDARAVQPIFDEPGPLRERDLRFADRAWRFGVPVRAIARRTGRPAGTVRRALRRRTIDRLRAAAPTWIDLPTFARTDADEVILAAPAILAGAPPPPPSCDVVRLIDELRSAAPVETAVEDALVAAYNLLKRRAARAVEAAPPWPPAGLVDDVTTDLRWALRVKERLVLLALPGAVARIEHTLHRPLAAQPADRIEKAMRLAVRIVGREVETVDPSREHRLDRRVRYAMDRELAEAGAPPDPGRAAARHEPGARRIHGLFAGITAWAEVVDLPLSLRVHTDALAGPARVAIGARFGLNGQAPLRIAALAGTLGATHLAAARIVRSAEVDLIAMRRRTIATGA